MERDNRIYYDPETGYIISMTGEASGDVLPLPEEQDIAYVDIPYGSVDYTKNIIQGIDVETGKPIFKELPPPTTEQEQIADLTNQLEKAKIDVKEFEEMKERNTLLQNDIAFIMEALEG